MRFHSFVLAGFCATMVYAQSARAAALPDCPHAACSWGQYMPLYSQNNASISQAWLPAGPSRSMLCGPTSAAMAMETLIRSLGAPRVINQKFISTSVMAKAPHKQVEAMASKMGTSPTKGTGFAGMLKGTVDRAADFAVDLGASYTKLGSSALNLLIGSLSMVFDGHVFPDFDAADVRAGMQKPNTRELSVLVYGHYAKKTKKVLGVKFSRYKRDGGHVVAVNGYVGNKLAINDPWYASYHTYEPYRMKLFKKWNDIHIVPGSLGKGVSILYSEPQNNYYGIIDARYVLNVPRR